jgi:hypothetical protein
VFNLSKAQKRSFLLSDNRIGLDARVDRKALAGQIPELTLLFEEARLTLSDTGFEVAEIDVLVIDFARCARGRPGCRAPAADRTLRARIHAKPAPGPEGWPARPPGPRPAGRREHPHLLK